MDTDEPALDPKRVADLRDLAGPEMPELPNEVARIFADVARVTVQELLEAAERGSVPDVRHHAHKIKGSSGNVGAMVLAGLCEEIEAAARRDAVIHHERVADVAAELDRVMDALAAEFDLEG